MTTIPCEECITLSICKAKIRKDAGAFFVCNKLAQTCQIVCDYMQNSPIDKDLRVTNVVEVYNFFKGR